MVEACVEGGRGGREGGREGALDRRGVLDLMHDLSRGREGGEEEARREMVPIQYGG